MVSSKTSPAWEKKIFIRFTKENEMNTRKERLLMREIGSTKPKRLVLNLSEESKARLAKSRATKTKEPTMLSNIQKKKQENALGKEVVTHKSTTTRVAKKRVPSNNPQVQSTPARKISPAAKLSNTKKPVGINKKYRHDRCFLPERRGDMWYHVLKLGQAPNTRGIISRSMSSLLQLSRYLTPLEETLSEYQLMKSRETHHLESELGSYPYAEWTSAEDIFKFHPEVWPKLVEINKIMTDPGYEEFLKKHQGPEKKGTRTYNCMMSVQPGHGDDRMQMGKIAKAAAEKNNKQHLRVGVLLGEVSQHILEDFCSRHGISEMLKSRYRKDASMTFGSKHNKHTTSLQFNICPPEKGGLRSLGAKGRTHADTQDHLMRFSALFFMGNLDFATTFPGRFNMTSVRLTCTAEPYSCLVFSGRHPHRGSGTGLYDASIPEDSSLRYQQPPGVPFGVLKPGTPQVRAVAIAYATDRLTRPNDKPKNEIWEKVGLAHFGDLENQHECKMRYHVKKLKDSQTPASEMPSADDLVEKFRWTDPETKAIMYPSKSEAAACLAGTTVEDDEKWENMEKVVKSTACGIQAKDRTPDEVALVSKINHDKATKRAENRRRAAAGLPKLPRARRLVKPKNQDPTDWTEMEYDTTYHPSMEERD